MDVVLLARLQFALTIAFHYLFPPLTIGMGIALISVPILALVDPTLVPVPQMLLAQNTLLCLLTAQNSKNWLARSLKDAVILWSRL